MSPQRLHMRSPKRLLDDLKEEIHRARNEDLMEGIVAACALVAYADGWVTPEEQNRMLGLIRKYEPIAAFGLHDVTMTFESLTRRFEMDQKDGEAAALQAVRRVKGVTPYPALLVETCCAIATADGGFDAEERKVVLQICELLELNPEEFGIADAP